MINLVIRPPDCLPFTEGCEISPEQALETGRYLQEVAEQVGHEPYYRDLSRHLIGEDKLPATRDSRHLQRVRRAVSVALNSELSRKEPQTSEPEAA